ncbi:MAG: hypothetical protein JNM10_06840 [Planctomycetia bacterium]|nr:hypothetical protein [Planctomycetia bacterium]
MDVVVTSAPLRGPGPGPVRRGLAAVGAFALGGIFLFAAYAKLIDPIAFADVIRDEGLDLLFSAKTVAQLAIGVEVGLGLALVLGVRTRSVLVLTTGLVAFFLFLTGRAYLYDKMGWADAKTSCGCFGNLVHRSPSEALLQDALMLIPTLGAAWLAPTPGSPAPLRRVLASLVATVGAVVFAVAAPNLPLDDLATRLSPGRRVDELCTAAEQKCLRDALPLLVEGRHVVVLTDLDEPAFREAIPELNGYAADGKGPRLWVLTAAPAETVTMFGFATGASFPIQVTDKAIVRPLYRRLPRSFHVIDGVVTATWDGLPPLRSLSATPPG